MLADAASNIEPQVMVNLHCSAPSVSADKLAEYESVLSTCQHWPALSELLGIVRERLNGGFQYMLPMPDERQALGQLLDNLTEPQRTPAFHLLWCINELALGREPHFV